VNILIVEDVKSMAMAAQKMVTLAKHHADIALTPTEARERVANNHYEAILMDFGLPEMDGLELTTLLRETGFAGLIIGLTANPKMFTVEQMKAAGLNACLEKPLLMQKLKLLELEPGTTDFETKF